MISVPILFCLIASVLAQSADQGSFPTSQSHKPHKTPSNHQPPKLSSSIKPSDPSSSNIKHSSSNIKPPDPSSSNIKPSEPISSNIKPPKPSSSKIKPSEPISSNIKPSEPISSNIKASKPSSSNIKPPDSSSSKNKPSEPSPSSNKSPDPSSSNIKPSKASSANIKPPDSSSSSIEPSDLSFPNNKPSPPTFSSIEPPKNTSSSHHNSEPPSSGPQPSKTSKCPFVRSPPYNLSAMCGEWYVYESSLNVRSKDERCIKVKLEEYPVGKFKLTSKSYITSINTTSTVVTDVIVKNKDNGVLSSHVPLFGSTDKPVTLLTVERDYVILYSCQIRGAKRVESAWVFIKYASSPPIWLDDKVENAFLDHNLDMPNMNSSDYEKCLDVFSSYQFDPAPTPGNMIVSCFLNTTCLTEKWREFMTLLIPYRR